MVPAGTSTFSSSRRAQGPAQSSTDSKKQFMDLTPRKEAEEAKEAPQEVRPVLRKGLVLRVQENSTRLAELGSFGLQTSLHAETRSVGSQTSIFSTHLGTMQQWRSIQGAYRVGLQRLQHPSRQLHHRAHR